MVDECVMKITVLTHLEREGSKAFDVVVEQVARSLRRSGHAVSVLGVHGDVRKLIGGLQRRKPDLIFNLMEMFGDNVRGDIGVVGLLDLLGIPYTGGGPGEFYLQEDKLLTKKLLAFEHLKYPDFAVFARDASLETGGHLRLPLFVKPLSTDGSIGITSQGLVHSAPEMMERVLQIQKEVNDSALVEEYIEGREFYVGILGNQETLAFPPIEMDFSGLPKDSPHVLDVKAKWDKKSPEYAGTKPVLADVPDETRARLQKTATDAYRALRVRDYGRVDLRLTDTGDVYVIEVNASCYLEESGEFAMGAAAAGLAYPTLLKRIVALAEERHKQRAGRRGRKK